MRRRWPLVAACALLAGCGGLPIAGGVRVERTVLGGANAVATGVRVLPPAPAPGAGPAAIVKGFLNAQADGEGDYGIARLYLAPGARWDDTQGALVYAAAAAGPVRAFGRADTVPFTLDATGTLDAVGGYVPKANAVHVAFTLVRVAGSWRIAALPQLLLLSQQDLQRSFVPLDLWWYTPDYSLLIPEQRWLPSLSGARQTTLVRALLAGPGKSIAGAVRTAVPAGARLEGSATLSGTDVVVDLGRAAASLQAVQAQRLLLQLAQTLSQVPAVGGVRLTADGQPLPLAGVPQRIDLASAASVHPDESVATASAVAVVGGRVQATGALLRPDLSVSAMDTLAGQQVALAVPRPDGTQLAALIGPPGHRAVVSVAADGAERPLLVAGAWTSLSWSAGGVLLAAGPAGLALLVPGRPVVALASVALLAGGIQDAHIARDGVRIAVVAGPPGHGQLYLGTLSGPPGAPRLGGLVDIAPALADVAAVGWASCTALDVLASTSPSSLPQLWQIAPDGSQSVGIALPADLALPGAQLAVAPNAPALVAAHGVIERLDASGWHPLAEGTAPAYPG